MGRPKPWLPFGPEPMLQRVVRLVAEAVRPVVVVAAGNQDLPELPPGVPVVFDRQPDRGPLEGIAVGLAALRPEAEAAFVTACDTPLLRPALVRRLIELAEGYEVVVPHIDGIDGYDHPLSAVYRTSILSHVESLLAAGRLRPAFLFDRVRTRRVTADELIDVDPSLESLINVNSAADYAAAMERAGFGKPILNDE
jgi:molybdopterin-guanine dinucleotide biosynthesis protein A